MKAFLVSCVVAIGIAVVAGWVLQDYAATSSQQADTTGAARID